jgi:hypothetical protein
MSHILFARSANQTLDQIGEDCYETYVSFASILIFQYHMADLTIIQELSKWILYENIM